MAFNPDIPDIDNPGLSDIPKMKENFLQLRKCEAGVSAPADPPEGCIWVSTGNDLVKQFLNGVWVTLFSFAGVLKLSLDTSIVDAIVKTMIKTGTGSVIITGHGGAVVMQDYCFFPNFSTNYSSGGGEGDLCCVPTNLDNTIGRVYITSSLSAPIRIIRFRYITSSDKPFIYLLKDKQNKVISIWECNDPPPGYWGLNKKPDNFIPPVILDDPSQIEEEIICFNYPLELFEKHRKEIREQKISTLQYFENMRFHQQEKIFVPKDK